MKHSIKFIIITGILSFSFLITGCAGARGKIKLEELNHPVSMSPYLYDKNGKTLSINNGLDYSRGLFIRKKYFGTFYTTVRLTGDGDLSRQIDDAITAADSDGIVNFHYVVDQGGTNGCVPLTWLPVWPGTSDVVFMGDIVKLSKGRR
ncbi:MAG TPA: hypothetical protein PK906_09160 [Spirochaetota bacterium]|nr:hypothetical protein [Spirochaetota bacterium]